MNKVLKAVGTIELFEINGDNESGFTGILYEDTQFSMWKDETNFTSAMIKEIYDDAKSITIKETKKVLIYIWYTQVAKEIKIGSILELGTPFYSVGKFHTEELLEIPDSGVFD